MFPGRLPMSNIFYTYYLARNDESCTAFLGMISVQQPVNPDK